MLVDAATMIRTSAILQPDEIRAFTRRSDAAGALAILWTWGAIAAAFTALALVPHPVTFVVAVALLGGRQLALAVLMHEAAHRTLFRTRFLNDRVADWLCARPVWTDVRRYREHHLAHHAHAGTERDPDRSLVEGFPLTGRSLVRKMLRDLAGVSGVKRVLGLALMDAELIGYTVAGDVKPAPRRRVRDHARAFAIHASPALVANLAILATLALAGHAWLYSAWAAAWLTTYGLFLRIRSMAEHACTEGGRDPMRNTRTTRAGLLARMFVAPHAVGYHLEHHLLPTAPCHRLPALHRRLSSAGVIPPDAVARDYLAVLRIMVGQGSP